MEDSPNRPFKSPGWFKPGNKYGVGRPSIKLTKPELLLPLILAKGKVNWANDFIKLYKIQRERLLYKNEQALFDFIKEMMPYLCTKVQLKELDIDKKITPFISAMEAKQKSAFLKQLEQEANAKPPAAPNGSTGSVESGQPVLPPPTQSA